VEVHPFFDTAGLKSWDIKHITDVQELLRGTSSTSISLQGASAVFGLESPKTLLAGEEVNSLYWSEDKDRLEKISTYASKDTLTACNLLCKLLNQPIKELELVAEKEVVVEELPLLQKINNSKNIGEKEKEELKQIFTKKKLTKKDKDIIFDLIRASLAEIDSNFGKVVNQKQIDEIINQLKEEFESN
jgi:hypothetical protein